MLPIIILGKLVNRPWKHAAEVSAIAAVTLLTLGSGVLNLYSVSPLRRPARFDTLLRIFPLEFLAFSHFLTLLMGLALVISAINIAKRKRRAWMTTLALSGASTIFQVLRAGAYEEACISAALFLALCFLRNRFSVRSRSYKWTEAAFGLGASLAALFAYGIAGFYFLDQREFGISFGLTDSVLYTLRLATFTPGNFLIPHTRYGAWFLHSIAVLGLAAAAYSVYAIFRPVLWTLRTHPAELERAQRILQTHGRSSLDHFKAQPAKSLFFSRSRQSFLAYRVGGGVAVVLGDPIGPAEEIPSLIRDFLDFGGNNDWRICVYEALPDWAEAYRAAGLHKLKIGDDAIVDLEAFTLDGPAARRFRGRVKSLEKMGVTTRLWDPPIPPSALAEARQISEDWLQIPGRRQRGFSTGWFQDSAVRNTPLFTVHDAAGKMLAFANIIPSGRKDEATVDMMRHLRDAPNGIMDFLFVKLFLWNKARGYKRFTLGMAPMGGFQPSEHPARAERYIHSFVRRLEFLFSFQGLRAYKAKFANLWEPRFLYFQHYRDLPAIGLALRSVSELPDHSGHRRIRSLLRWATAAVCLAWVFQDIEGNVLAGQFKEMRWTWAVAAILADMGSYFFEATRWRYLLRSLGSLPILRGVQSIYAGLFINEVLPMRAGDLIQGYLGSRFVGAPFASVLPAQVVGAVIDGLWIALAIGVVAILVPMPAGFEALAHWFGVGMAILTMLVVAILLPRARSIANWARPTRSGWRGKLTAFLAQSADGLASIRPIPDLAAAFAASIGIPLLQALAFWFAMKACRVDLPFLAAAAVFLIVHLGTAIPNAPSNLGSYQLLTVLGLRMFGVEKTQAAGFSVAVFLLLTAPFWIAGPIALARAGLSLKSIRTGGLAHLVSASTNSSITKRSSGLRSRNALSA